MPLQTPLLTETPIDTATGFFRLKPWYQYFTSVTSAIADLYSKIADLVSTNTAEGTVRTEKTLTAATTKIDAPPSGRWWVVEITQDGTGGRAITWSSDVKAASTSLGDAIANKISVFVFVRSTIGWVQVGQQTTDMTP